MNDKAHSCRSQRNCVMLVAARLRMTALGYSVLTRFSRSPGREDSRMPISRLRVVRFTPKANIDQHGREIS